MLLIDEAAGGQARLSPDGYLEGTPELVIEIAASSAAIDLGDKKQAYRRNGVPEYLVWQVYENRLDWFCLVDGDYQPLPMAADGVMRSATFPGLWLAVTALLQGNMAEVLAGLQAGIQSPKHQQFVAGLSSTSP